MGVTPEELAAAAAVGPAPPGALRPFRVLPGGARAVPDEWYAAGVILASLGILWAMRRNLDAEPGHVHVSGTSAIIFLLYYLIVTGLVRVAISAISRGGERDTPATRGLSFFA